MPLEITYSAETPADHCFHALQLLAGADRSEHCTILTTARAIALRRSLELALQALNAHRYELTPAGRAAIAKPEP